MKPTQRWLKFEGRRIRVFQAGPQGEGLITLRFDAGRNGKREAGNFQFWVIHAPVPFPGSDDGWNCAVARIRESKSLTDRLKRLRKETIKSPFHQWLLDNVVVAYPAQPHMVEHWLKTHPDDAPFARCTQ